MEGLSREPGEREREDHGHRHTHIHMNRNIDRRGTNGNTKKGKHKEILRNLLGYGHGHKKSCT